jgi:hypothetical protein
MKPLTVDSSTLRSIVMDTNYNFMVQLAETGPCRAVERTSIPLPV